MILRKFTNIYPRTLWVVVIESSDDLLKLSDIFTFYHNTPGFDKVNDGIITELKNSYNGDTAAECYPVMLNSNAEIGVLSVLYKPEFIDGSTVAHESVHISDYYFEVTGMTTQDFSESGGNEGYAYLVGWIAGCFIKVMKEYGKTE